MISQLFLYNAHHICNNNAKLTSASARMHRTWYSNRTKTSAKSESVHNPSLLADNVAAKAHLRSFVPWGIGLNVSPGWHDGKPRNTMTRGARRVAQLPAATFSTGGVISRFHQQFSIGEIACFRRLFPSLSEPPPRPLIERVDCPAYRTDPQWS